MNKRGSVTILIGSTMPVILVAGVFAVDAARVWLAKSRLQTALDAAALSAARDMNDGNTSQMIANAQAIAGNLAGQTGTIQIEQTGANSVKVTGSVSVPPIMAGLKPIIDAFRPVIGDKLDAAAKPRVVVGEAVADRSNTGIELALVIDTTLSMALWDSKGGTDPDGKKPARIELARRAARDLTGILYGGQQVHQPNLYISVVPFNVAINIGKGNTGLLRADATEVYTNGHSWSGCVEARLDGNDVTDAAPDTLATRFPRYFWPDTYRSLETSATIYDARGNVVTQPFCTTHQDYNPNGTGACWGDNDWGASEGTQTSNGFLKVVRGFPSYYGNYVVGATNTYFSPNLMCPTVPVLPLTMHRGKVEATIDALIGTPNNAANTVPNSSPSLYYDKAAYPFGYGTVIASGLQGAWYTLSPSWKDAWPNPNPVIDGKQLQPPLQLPLPYDTERMKKVVLLLSDGDNNWFNARSPQGLEDISGTGGSNTLVRTASRRSELFYSAYGRLTVTNNRLDVTIPQASNPPAANSTALRNNYDTLRTNADAKLDSVTLSLCTKMKEKGIIIYAVGIGVAETAHHNLLQACVTPKATPEERNKYIRTNNAGELRAAFTQVANELANLRLKQ